MNKPQVVVVGERFIKMIKLGAVQRRPARTLGNKHVKKQLGAGCSGLSVDIVFFFFFKQAAMSYKEGPLQKEGGDAWP